VDHGFGSEVPDGKFADKGPVLSTGICLYRSPGDLGTGRDRKTGFAEIRRSKDYNGTSRSFGANSYRQALLSREPTVPEGIS